MTSAGAGAARLDAVLAASGLRPTEEPTLLPSHSNDTWLLSDRRHGEVVLRTCWRGDTSRLLREGAVARLLPAAVGYPDVIQVGRVPGSAGLTWTVTRRLGGRPLAAAWPDLDHATRVRACEQAANMITALHRWRPPQQLHRLLVPTPNSVDASAADVIGRSINPLPDGVPALVAELRSTGRQLAVLSEALALLERDAALGPRWDSPASGVVHSDLHLDNIWWSGTQVSGLLDLEWVRAAPPYVELARVKDQADLDDTERSAAHQLLMEVMTHRDPSLIAIDHLSARLRVLQVSFQLRELCRVGLLSDTEQSPPADHPSLILEALLGG
jgi:aminoglycoside phosphotransferase